MNTENGIATKNVPVGTGMKVKTNGVARSLKVGNMVKCAAVIIVIATLFVLSQAEPARMQLDPIGGYEIHQNGIKVGEIYVPQRDLGDTNYVEHWVLYNNYVYPGRDSRLVTSIKMGRLSYDSEEDFFARVPWGPGFRYVRVDCIDTAQLPGR